MIRGMSCCDRRTFLAGVSVAGVTAAGAAVTAGCTKYNTVATPNVPTSKSGGATTLAANEVPLNGGVILSADRTVVTQPEAGVYKAFSSVCTHAGCSVTKVSDNKIHCPCHGSAFDAVTGAVVNGPATAALAGKTVTAKDGTLTLG